MLNFGHPHMDLPCDHFVDGYAITKLFLIEHSIIILGLYKPK